MATSEGLQRPEALIRLCFDVKQKARIRQSDVSENAVCRASEDYESTYDGKFCNLLTIPTVVAAACILDGCSVLRLTAA